MDLLLIKKTSKVLMIIGLLTLIFNSLINVILSKQPSINYFTFILIGIGTIIMFIGTRKPSKIIVYLQLFLLYSMIYLCFIDDPENPAGIFLSIIHYIIITEHKIIKKFMQKVLVIGSYALPILYSSIFLHGLTKNIFATYLLVSFFSFFLYTYIHHKKEVDSKTIEKSIQVITKLEPITEELVEISKRQIELVDKQARQIEEYKKSSIAV